MKLQRKGRQLNKVAATTAGVALIVVLGKLLGFGREALIAAYYGATAETDAFFFAFNMPAMLFPAICSSISTAFISLYVKHITERGEAEGDRYASRMLTASIVIGLVLSGLGVLVSPLLVPLLAPGFSGGQLTLAVRLARMSMASFILLMLQYMLGAILNSRKRFIGSQVSALLYSVAIIVVTVLLGPGQSMYLLMKTVIFANLIYVVALLICCRGQFHYQWFQNPIHPETRHFLKLSLPILLGNSVVQINTIVDKALGSILPGGSLSALTYGNTLSSLVISVFVVSLSTVLYPTLTSDAASGNLEQYGATLESSICSLSLILMPISCITVLSASDIVEFVYARGSFDATAVTYTAIVLACYAPMFVASGIREVLTRGFFALQETRTPMQNSAIGVGCNIAFSLLFVRWLGIAGIALGTTLSALITAILLLVSAHRRLKSLAMVRVLRKLLKQFLAGGITVAALLVFRQHIALPYALLRFLANTAVGFSAYAGALLLLRYRRYSGIS